MPALHVLAAALKRGCYSFRTTASGRAPVEGGIDKDKRTAILSSRWANPRGSGCGSRTQRAHTELSRFD